MNRNGFIEIRTTKLAADTTFSKFLQLTLFNPMPSKAIRRSFIQRFAKIYTPTIVVLAFIGSGHSDANWKMVEFNHWLQQAITLLVIACPWCIG
jgi:Cd2+/Zn2+-exporting ATPase